MNIRLAELLQKYTEKLNDLINPDDSSWEDLGFEDAPEGYQSIREYLYANGEFDENKQAEMTLLEEIIEDLKDLINQEENDPVEEKKTPVKSTQPPQNTSPVIQKKNRKKIHPLNIIEPPKMGRPKKTDQPAKKRGRPPKNPVVQDALSPMPKRRGRPPKNPVVQDAIAPIPKRRGRPPKNPIVQDTIASNSPTIQDTVAPMPKRRGRPPKIQPVVTPKRRGRPPKQA